MRNLVLKLKYGTALIARVRDDFSILEYVIASGYTAEDGTWVSGQYYGAESICAAVRAFEMTVGTSLMLSEVPEYVRRNGLNEFSVSLGNLILYVFERGDGDFEYSLYNVRDGRKHEVEGGVLETKSIYDAYRVLTGCFSAFSDRNAEAEIFPGVPEEVI